MYGGLVRHARCPLRAQEQLCRRRMPCPACRGIADGNIRPAAPLLALTGGPANAINQCCRQPIRIRPFARNCHSTGQSRPTSESLVTSLNLFWALCRKSEHALCSLAQSSLSAIPREQGGSSKHLRFIWTRTDTTEWKAKGRLQAYSPSLPLLAPMVLLGLNDTLPTRVVLFPSRSVAALNCDTNDMPSDHDRHAVHLSDLSCR